MSSHRPRILVVDDEAEVLGILRDFLVEQGFDVRTAAHGNEAILEAKRWTPKAVLLDLMMPDIGGLEILARITHINPGIAVIFISGQLDALEILTQAGLRGARALPKPLNLPALLETLAEAGVVPMSGSCPSADEETAGPEAVPARPSIMVVDDEVDVREVLVEYLEFKGFEVCHAASGEEALAKVGECCPDVVLLDLGLPGLSGIETLRRLRIDSPRSRVFVVSGNQDQDLARKALAMGAADYVPKPVDFGYLEGLLVHGVGPAAAPRR